jgi:hypothetical protein
MTPTTPPKRYPRVLWIAPHLLWIGPSGIAFRRALAPGNCEFAASIGAGDAGPYRLPNNEFGPAFVLLTIGLVVALLLMGLMAPRPGAAAFCSINFALGNLGGLSAALTLIGLIWGPLGCTPSEVIGKFAVNIALVVATVLVNAVWAIVRIRRSCRHRFSRRVGGA